MTFFIKRWPLCISIYLLEYKMSKVTHASYAFLRQLHTFVRASPTTKTQKGALSRGKSLSECECIVVIRVITSSPRRVCRPTRVCRLRPHLAYRGVLSTTKASKAIAMTNTTSLTILITGNGLKFKSDGIIQREFL